MKREKMELPKEPMREGIKYRVGRRKRKAMRQSGGRLQREPASPGLST